MTKKPLAEMLPDTLAQQDVVDAQRARARRDAAAQAVEELAARRTPTVPPGAWVRLPEGATAKPRVPKRIYAILAFTLSMPFVMLAMMWLKGESESESVESPAATSAAAPTASTPPSASALPPAPPTPTTSAGELPSPAASGPSAPSSTPHPPATAPKPAPAKGVATAPEPAPTTTESAAPPPVPTPLAPTVPPAPPAPTATEWTPGKSPFARPPASTNTP